MGEVGRSAVSGGVRGVRYEAVSCDVWELRSEVGGMRYEL